MSVVRVVVIWVGILRHGGECRSKSDEDGSPIWEAYPLTAPRQGSEVEGSPSVQEWIAG